MTNATATPSGSPRQRAERARLRLSQALAIDGLPPTLATLATGRAYAVYATRSPARDALFWKTAVHALSTPANVISTRTASDVIDAFRQQGLDITQQGAVHPRSNICALKLSEHRDGFELLMEALEAMADQCASPATPFLIEGVAACFAWNDRVKLVNQGSRLAHWCAQRRHTVLLVMLPPLVGQQDGHLPLTDFQVHFGGAAQLLQVQGEYRWEVAFWRDYRNVIAAYESLPLRFSLDDSRLVVASDDGTVTGRLAPDEGDVLVAAGVVTRERTVAKSWRVVPDNDALVADASHAVAATVIFHYGLHDNLATLAKQVNFLRRQCGKALKILVREDNVSVRYEHVLLTLGANLIIPRSTPLAQVEVMIEGVQGQLFSRPVPDDYVAALSAAMRDATTGYVPVVKFVTLVEQAVERSRSIRLPNVLLRLLLEPDVATLDALRACRIRRSGDLCTASGDSLYVFLFACHVDDAGLAMDRVFGRPLVDLFRGELRCGDRDSIVSMLDALRREVAELPAPDYTGLVEAAVVAPAQPSDAGSTDPVRDVDVLPIWTPAADEAQSPADGIPTARPSPRRAALPMKARS